MFKVKHLNSLCLSELAIIIGGFWKKQSMFHSIRNLGFTLINPSCFWQMELPAALRIGAEFEETTELSPGYWILSIVMRVHIHCGLCLYGLVFSLGFHAP